MVLRSIPPNLVVKLMLQENVVWIFYHFASYLHEIRLILQFNKPVVIQYLELIRKWENDIRELSL